MCVIVDANLASLVFATPASAEFVSLLNWLFHADGCLVSGGRNKRELTMVACAKRALLNLHRAGRAQLLRDVDVDEEENHVTSTLTLRSDDPHVVALARLSGARTLCTNDRQLCDDFRNVDLVPRPKGRVYRNSGHRHLLCHTRGCGRFRRSSRSRW